MSSGDRPESVPLVIRPAGVRDAPGIARVHVDTWRSAYRGLIAGETLDALSYEGRSRRWAEWLGTQRSSERTFIAERGEIVGFCHAGPARGKDPAYSGEIYALYVLPIVQGQGVGRRLFETAVHHLASAGLGSFLVWVLADNPHRRFYEQLGGTLLGSQPIEIGGQVLTEVAYGWKNPAALRLTR